MKNLYTRIGEHFMQIVYHSDTFMNWIQRNFSALAPTRAKPDLFIYLTEGYGIPFVDYNVQITREADTVSFRRADYLIEADLDYRHARVAVHNELALKHALMNLYSSYLVHHQWGLLIHSSCVMDKGKAHMFAGQSGAGKSTAAKLSLPRELLSDEATLVKITSHEILAFNSPFRSELDVTNAEAYCPLASIQLLNQALINRRVSLKKSNGLLLLMDKVFYWNHKPEDTKKVLGLLTKLTDAVPIYELDFQKNNTFWELIS
jgi:hypothetical protein